MRKDKVIQVGNHIEPKGFMNPQCGRVYSALGVSPTLNTCGGGRKATENIPMRQPWQE